MARLFVAAVLAFFTLAAQATLTTYEWTIDWQNRPDQSGTLTFDDEGDTSARGVSWNIDFGRPVPPTVTGLPPGLGVLGLLSYDGSFVTNVRGCSDPFGACSPGGATRFGFTFVQFELSSFGDALNYIYNYSGGDPASGCLNPALLAGLPESCFAIDRGVTTFTAVTAAVPEPSTWALLLGGLVSLALVGRRRRLKAEAEAVRSR
jgi:hypothetical protein